MGFQNSLVAAQKFRGMSLDQIYKNSPKENNMGKSTFPPFQPISKHLAELVKHQNFPSFLKGHPNIQPINFWWSDGSGKQHHMRFGWWPLCWIGRIGVAEEKEFDSGKPREEFGNLKKQKTPSKKSWIKAALVSRLYSNFQRHNWDLFNDSLRGFYIILKYVLCKMNMKQPTELVDFKLTLWDEVINGFFRCTILKPGGKIHGKLVSPVIWLQRSQPHFETRMKYTSRSISSWVCAAGGNSPTIYRTKKQLPAPSPTKKIWSDGVRCNIASPNNSINIHHLQLVDINHFEAEFSISWGRCPCLFCSFPLQKCPWITCHLFFFWGMVTLLKRVEGFTSPSNGYIRYSQLIFFMSSVSVTPLVLYQSTSHAHGLNSNMWPTP